MKKTVIYDYEEFEIEMNEIIKKSKSNIYPFIEIENNWKTECNLPIKHYSIGSGNNHLDFIPMVNPEGYLITTSIIRTVIPRNIIVTDIEKHEINTG